MSSNQTEYFPSFIHLKKCQIVLWIYHIFQMKRVVETSTRILILSSEQYQEIRFFLWSHLNKNKFLSCPFPTQNFIDLFTEGQLWYCLFVVVSIRISDFRYCFDFAQMYGTHIYIWWGDSIQYKQYIFIAIEITSGQQNDIISIFALLVVRCRMLCSDCSVFEWRSTIQAFIFILSG